MSKRSVILIIEDQADIRSLIRMTLEMGNNEIHEAENGDSGWHMVRAARDFEQAGLQVLPAPMGFKGGQARKLYRVLPRASALSDSSLALHEWLGILAQRASLDR